jgi:hypothetical protein
MQFVNHESVAMVAALSFVPLHPMRIVVRQAHMLVLQFNTVRPRPNDEGDCKAAE